MSRTACSALLLCWLLPLTARADAPKGGPEPLRRLEFRNIGPACGGRVSRACGVPGDPRTYYAATAAGGVWKSTDGGHNWGPVSDEVPLNTAGAIAVAPSDPNVVYVGAGEANIRGNVEVGNGIFRSTDAGKTWKHVWKQEGQIGALAVHPRNADVAYAAILGRAFGPSPERGVFRTTDGGATWKKVLFQDADTGASDVALDPANPRILYAGMWQTRRLPWEMTSGGPGSGLWKSTDGGDTWTRLVARPKDDEDGKAPAGQTHAAGLPKGIWGKVGLAVAPSSPKRIYALIEAEEGGLFRSDDAGESWERVNDHRALRQRAWYFSTLAVHPANPDVVWVPQVPLLRSTDGGKTFARVKGPHHGDHHDLWIDPKDPDRMIDSNDGGVDISLDGGKSWFAPQLPLGQLYHVAVDNSTPYRVACTIQDIGTACAPSHSLTGPGLRLADWLPVGGGEAGHITFHPADPNVVYAGEYSGYLSRWDRRTRQAKNISVYPFTASGFAPEALRIRFQWTAPVLASRHEPGTVYHAGNVVLVTRDDGKTWKQLGGDLTRNDRKKQQWSGGPITGDNTGVEVHGTVFALAESPRQKGLLWAGSDDGLVHVSRDGGARWENVTGGLKGLPEWGTVTCIEPSPHAAGTAYVVADAHRVDDRKAYLWKTEDHGATWTSLAGKIPGEGYLQVVREDPEVKGLLYAGRERGLVFSRDGGANWEELVLNLPPVRVSDLRVKDGDLVVATSGRSVWVLDDLTPLRAAPSAWAGKLPTVQPIRPATRWRLGGASDDGFPAWRGANPPGGAVIHYHLPTRPAGELTLRVRDAKGKVVRTLTSKKEEADEADLGAYSAEDERKPLPTAPGLHRVVWDLRHDGARTIKGGRVDMGAPRDGPLAAPGPYTVELSADGHAVSRPVEVTFDPRGGKDEARRAADLAGQLELALHVREDIGRLSDAVEQLRTLRKQVQARDELLKAGGLAPEVVKRSGPFLAKLDELEGRLHNPKAKVSYDILAQRGGAQLYSQLAFLFEQLKDDDGPVTQGVREQTAEQGKKLEEGLAAWRKLLAEAAEMNARAVEAGAPALVLPKR